MQFRERRQGRRLVKGIVAVVAMLLVVAPIKTEAGTTSFSLSGVITTSNGDPVAGATVELRDAYGQILISTSTSADGTYSFTDVPVPPAYPEVRARAVPPAGSPLLPAGWRPSGPPPIWWEDDFGHAIPVSAGANVSGIDIVLLEPGTISGVVRDPDGNPVADAQISLLRDNTSHGQETTTALDGSYTIEQVLPGTWEVAAYPPEGLPFVGVRSELFEVDEGAEAIVDITLPLGAVVSGNVVDPGGVPIEGVRVHLVWLDEFDADELVVLTGADGSYRVQGLYAGTNPRVWFEPPAGSTLASQWYPLLDHLGAGVTTVPLTLGVETTSIDAELRSQGSLTGAITGADGEPAAGVRVSLTHWPYYHGHSYVAPPPPPTETDASGQYDFGAVDGGPWLIRYDPPEGSPDAEEWHDGQPAWKEGPGGTPFLVTSASGTALDATLALGGSIQGRVIGPHGSTPAVTVRADGGTGYTGSCLCSYNVDTGTAATDADGDYSVVGLMGFHAYMIGFSPEGDSGLVGQLYNAYSPCSAEEQFYTDCGGRNTPVALGAVTSGIDARLEPECAAGPFPDVALTNAHCNEVTDAAATGALVGYPDGTFQPNRPLTRLGAVVALWRLAGSPTGHASGPSSFTDIISTQPYREAIEWAADEGITTGYTDGTFRPSSIVTRQAAVTYLWRMAGKPREGTFTGFHDVASSHPFAKAITWASNHLITRGYGDGTFRPLAPINRASYAALLYWAPSFD